MAESEESAGSKNADSKNWAVLYLGSKSEYPKVKNLKEDRLYLTQGKAPLKSAKPEDLKKIQGIIALDANWKNAKTLWWRNAWLLKLTRVVLVTRSRSQFGNLRREPRTECLSTIESIGKVLDLIEGQDRYSHHLNQNFKTYLERYQNHS